MPYSSGGSSGPITLNGTQSPVTYFLATDPLGNSLIVGEGADAGFNFAHAQAADPTIFIHSHNQSTSQYVGISHNGANGVWTVGSGGTLFNSSFLSMGTAILYSGANTGATTTALSYTADAVWRLADGGGATKSWLQQSAGYIALNADYTNATATFSNTNLSVTVISGRTYAFSLSLFMSDSTAADGMKIDFSGGAAGVTNFIANAVLTNDTTGAAVNLTAATTAALATVINAAAMASTGVHLLVVEGSFVPSSSGTFIVRAAQNAHSTGTLTIKRGSWLQYNDVVAV